MEPDELDEPVVAPSGLSGVIYPTAESGFRPSTPEYASIDRTPNINQEEPAAQNYYPYYRETPALGHSRPYYPVQQQVQANQQQYQQQNIYTSSRAVADQSILGSGDFGVIRGGTFYQDNDPRFGGSAESNNDYYHLYNNGHGRPHADPYTQKNYYQSDQFANFRDFAEINAPGEAAYSHFVVVYQNKNGTTKHPNPKNIFEQLQLIDKEAEIEEESTTKEIPTEDKKIKSSKSKEKLGLTKTGKKYKKQLGPKDFEEPLLALS